MAASTCFNRCFSLASLAVIATTSIVLSATPLPDASSLQKIANRASGRVSDGEQAYRGSGRLDRDYSLLAYRASGRFSQELVYRASECGIETA